MMRVLNFFRGQRERLERDLARELRYHIDRRVEDLINTGLGEPEARRRANLELGGVPQVQEAVRDTWIWRGLDDLLQDIRHAVRSLTRNWGFALGAGAVLALAVGANTAIFSVVNTVLLQPLAYPDAGRLMSVQTFWTDTGRSSPDVSGPDFLDWQAHSDVFESMAVSVSNVDEAIVVGDSAAFGNSAYVSAEFFDVFGQAASAGRLLTQSDIPAADAPAMVAVVAYHWAAAHFGSEQGAIGKTITLYGDAVEIVGVAAPGFRYPGTTDVWAPARTTSFPASRSDHFYQAVGKLKGGVDLARAQQQLRTIGDVLARQHPENRLKTAAVVPLQERLTGSFQATLWVLMGAVGTVWLIACANIATLLIARAAARSREIALRAALGAGRGRVVRQLLTESCVLAAVAGLAGLLLASTLVQGLTALSPATLPGLDEVRIDIPALLFALGLSLASTVLFGLVPALQASRLALSDALKQGGSKATVSRTGARLRSALVAAEIALSVILLAGAGLLLRSFQTLQHVDLGFTTDRVLVAYTEYAVRDGAHFNEDLRTRSQFYAGVLDRLRVVPGVRAASGVAYLGLGREPRSPRDFSIQGRPEGRPGERPQAEYHAITADYFKTLEIPLHAGRDFDRTDTPERPPVAIVNETLARTAFGGESAIGQGVRTGTNPNAPWMEIVGVVGDTRWQDPSQPARAVIYAASTQGAGNSLAILARTEGEVQSLTGTLRALLHDANPTIPVKFETLDELFESTLDYPRFRTQAIGLFAGTAAVLAAIGIFSVLAYLVSQRTKELAVRRALGANAADVIRLVVGHGLRLLAIGLVTGLAGALALARLLTGFLYEVSPWDVGAYLGTVAVLGSAALLATLVPAMRAARIAPIVALQQE